MLKKVAFPTAESSALQVLAMKLNEQKSRLVGQSARYEGPGNLAIPYDDIRLILQQSRLTVVRLRVGV